MHIRFRMLLAIYLVGLAGGSQCPVDDVDYAGADVGAAVTDVADAMSCCLICREHANVSCGCWSFGYMASANANACWLKKASGWRRYGPTHAYAVYGDYRIVSCAITAFSLLNCGRTEKNIIYPFNFFFIFFPFHFVSCLLPLLCRDALRAAEFWRDGTCLLNALHEHIYFCL